MAGRKLQLTILVVSVTLSLLVAPIAHALTPSNADNRAVVAFVGDSNVALDGGFTVTDLTFGLETGNPIHWDDNYVPVFVARVGSGLRTPDCLPRGSRCATDDFWKLKLAHTFAAVHPGAIVTELGINDTRVPGTATTIGYADYGQKIDWFMKLLPTSARVFWTNLPCAIEPAALIAGCRIVNVDLGQAAKRWHNLVILNWASVANTHPEYMLTLPSGTPEVHYTATGYQAWSAFVTNALDAHFPDPR